MACLTSSTTFFKGWSMVFMKRSTSSLRLAIFECVFQVFDHELTHLEQGIHHGLFLRWSAFWVSHHAVISRWHYLPREAIFVLQPTAGAFLAPIRKLLPEVVNFFLV